VARAGATVFFALACDADAVRSVTLPPPPLADADTTTDASDASSSDGAAPLAAFAVIGDPGQTPHSAATMAAALAAGPALPAAALLLGDLSYADCVQARWDSWGRLASTLAGVVPTLSVVGNHEVEAECGAPFTAYEARFRMPGDDVATSSVPAVPAAPPPLWWSYESAGVLFLGLSSYSPVAPGSPQHAWLSAQLGAVRRSRTPWVVAALHAPWYNSNLKHQEEKEPAAMRGAFEGLLRDAGVDLVLAGHVHAYERSSGGVFDGEPDACAPSAWLAGCEEAVRARKRCTLTLAAAHFSVHRAGRRRQPRGAGGRVAGAAPGMERLPRSSVRVRAWLLGCAFRRMLSLRFSAHAPDVSSARSARLGTAG
jgi:hypothetical protein